MTIIKQSGRSSVWLERYVRDVEVARSNRVAPIDEPDVSVESPKCRVFLFFERFFDSFLCLCPVFVIKKSNSSFLSHILSVMFEF